MDDDDGVEEELSSMVDDDGIDEELASVVCCGVYAEVADGFAGVASGAGDPVWDTAADGAVWEIAAASDAGAAGWTDSGAGTGAGAVEGLSGDGIGVEACGSKVVGLSVVCTTVVTDVCGTVFSAGGATVLSGDGVTGLAVREGAAGIGTDVCGYTACEFVSEYQVVGTGVVGGDHGLYDTGGDGRIQVVLDNGVVCAEGIIQDSDSGAEFDETQRSEDGETEGANDVSNHGIVDGGIQGSYDDGIKDSDEDGNQGATDDE